MLDKFNFSAIIYSTKQKQLLRRTETDDESKHLQNGQREPEADSRSSTTRSTLQKGPIEAISNPVITHTEQNDERKFLQHGQGKSETNPENRTT